MISSPEFVGLENYRRLLDDGEARHALWITALLILFGLLPTIVIGLVAATLLNAKFRGIRYIRTLYYMPIVISLVASGVLWRFIYEPNRGLLNWLLSLIGIDGPPWLSSTRWALPAIAMVLVWLAIPLSTMLYLAALQGIPSTVLEAARIDGAGFVAMLWHVIWPMVRPTTALVSLVTVLGLAFGSFDLIASLTQGGPLDSTNTLIYYMYDTAFNQLQVGYASALAVFNFVAVFGTLGAVLAIGRRLVK
ncbi:carbohydrate ABC transporter permease [Ilumatobacter fluminis]|uniref:carbohydrate ABC transporter permease n=1 Tax=Ilumatobacter fluminis TaxID=467091 RepID=UPI001415239F|nr:sugar ABC transporter permease [Ilumatobacter fluminis]